MKWLAVVATLLFSASLFAQDAVKMRLKEVTWEPFQEKLSWIVEEGRVEKNGKFSVEKTRQYKIDFRAATMTDGKRVEKFTEGEADRVNQLLNMLVSGYAQESTVWFADPKKFDREHKITPPKEETKL